jgi:hypothetical protein
LAILPIIIRIYWCLCDGGHDFYLKCGMILLPVFFNSSFKAVASLVPGDLHWGRKKPVQP